MKCVDCEHYNLIEMRCEMNKMCIGKSGFKKRPSKKLSLAEIDIAEKLVQAKKNQEAEITFLRELKALSAQAINATTGYEEGLKQAKYIEEFPFNKPSEIQSPQIVRMSLQGYENLTNRVCNQELEIKNLKSAIEDMNSKLLKKNKEINELQAVIKTLGGLL